MSYIKFFVKKRVSDASGSTTYAKINRIESDMIPTKTIEPNIIWNAYYRPTKVAMWMKLDTGILDRDLVAENTILVLDNDRLNIDKLM